MIRKRNAEVINPKDGISEKERQRNQRQKSRTVAQLERENRLKCQKIIKAFC